MAQNQTPFNQLTVPTNKYGTDGSSLPQYQREFIQKFSPYAMLAASQTGLPARFILAEASIETDWGRSGSATRGNNMFGIKASPGQVAAGVPVEYLPTTEYRADGSKYVTTSPFIKYTSAEDGFNGFIQKLQNTKWPDQKALLNYRSATPFAQDDATEKALSDAFGRTSYLTMPGINQTMLDRMARLPADLQGAGFKVATDFSKAKNDLASLSSYDSGTGYQDVSNGLNNDGLGLLGINGITFNRTPEANSVLDQLSNSFTGGLRATGSALTEGFINLLGRLPTAQELQSGVEAVKNGTGSVLDQITNMARTPEAQGYAQQTGTDPFSYIQNRPDFSTLSASQGIGNGNFDFDASQYIAANPDVAAAGANPLAHFVQYGRYENRALDTAGDRLPVGFNDAAYLAQNPDVAAAGMNPLAHYLEYGANEHRNIGALDFAQYANTSGMPAGYGSLGQGVIPGFNVTATGTGTGGLTNAGDAQGLGASATGTGNVITANGTATGGLGSDGLPVGYSFDANAYAQANPDVQASGMDPLTHYATYGYNEGRALDAQGDRLNPGFSGASYLARNPDVATAGMNPLMHLMLYGNAEGRATGGFDNAATAGIGGGVTGGQNLTGVTATGGASGGFGGFDRQQYLNANSDVAASGLDPLTHFMRYGLSEGRAYDTAGDRLGVNFDGAAYLAQNPDVARSGMDPLQHYLEYGGKEGRQYTVGATPYNWATMALNQGVAPGSFGTGITPNPLITAMGTATGGLGPTTTPTYNASGYGYGAFNPAMNPLGGGGTLAPWGFSSANVGGGLGASPQSFGSYYGTNAGDMGAPAGGGGGIGAYDFGANTNVSGFDVNNLGGGQPAANSGGNFGDPNVMGGSGLFDPYASEMAYLRHQQEMIDANNRALAATNQHNANLAALGPTLGTAVRPTFGAGSNYGSYGNYPIGTPAAAWGL